MVNNGKITPDWNAIEECRAQFQAQKFDNSVGYDFRLPEQRERIFALYQPCLPRKLFRGRDKSFWALADALNVVAATDQILANWSAEVGLATGIRPLSHTYQRFNRQAVNE